MYISTKKGQSKENNKAKSLGNLLSMIQFTMSVPKGYSKVYEQFFDIVIKANAIQMKLIEKADSKGDPLPKYKKYLEGKIYTFLHSILPLRVSTAQSPSQIPSKLCVQSKGHPERKAFTPSVIHSLHRNSKDRKLKTSYSIEGSWKNTPLLMSSSSSQPSFKATITAHHNHAHTQCDSDANHHQNDNKQLQMYLKVTHPMIKTEHYSTASSPWQEPLSSSSSLITKSKSILKKYCTNSNQLKKTNVTFKEENNSKSLKE